METVGEFFKGKRVLVTGGAGFIGTHLCRRLHGLGAGVLAVDTNPGRGNPWPAYKLDVTTIQHLKAEIRQSDSQVVFHLAAKTEVGRSLVEPWETLWTNWGGTLNVLESCRVAKDKGWGLRAVVVASSDKAYGPVQSPFFERDQLLPSPDPYGNGKRAADDLSHDYARTFDLPLRVLRCCNTFGPGQRNETTLVTAAVLASLRGGRPQVHEGACLREWLYVEDAVEAYLLAAVDAASGPPPAAKLQGGYAFNVGGGARFSPVEVVSRVLRACERDVTAYDVVPRDNRPADYDQAVSSAKFRDRFPDWNPTPFWPALLLTLGWYKANLSTFGEAAARIDEKTKGVV